VLELSLGRTGIDALGEILLFRRKLVPAYELEPVLASAVPAIAAFPQQVIDLVHRKTGTPTVPTPSGAYWEKDRWIILPV